MAEIIKDKLDQKQKSYTSWLVKTIKNIIKRPVKEISLPVFLFRTTQEAELHKINILFLLYGNLVKAMKSQKLIHLDYGSDFRDITGIIKLFSKHKDKNIIVNTVQKGSQYHLSFIEEETGNIT